MCCLQFVVKVDRSNSQLSCSQPLLVHSFSTVGSSTNAEDVALGENVQANDSVSTSLTFCYQDAAVTCVPVSSWQLLTYINCFLLSGISIGFQ